MPGAVETDELRHVFQALRQGVGAAFGDYGHIAQAEFQQAFTAAGIVDYVDRFESYAFARKKLFRPETAASAGLGEKNKTLGGFFHWCLSGGAREWRVATNLRIRYC